MQSNIYFFGKDSKHRRFSRTVAECMAMCGHDEVVTVERNSRTDAEPKAMCDPAEGVTVERKSRTVPEPSYV